MPEMTSVEKFFINRRGTRSYRKMLDRIASAGQLSLTATSQVLELGAGNGGLSALIAERYHPARVYVTDYDPEQVAVAKQHLGSYFGAIPPSIVLEREDAAHLTYPDGTFDLVMAHYMLHHLGSIEDIFRGLREIERVLRPGGRLLYAEMFHKQEIRERLIAQGFVIAFHERPWRILHRADVVIAMRPSPNPGGNEPKTSPSLGDTSAKDVGGGIRSPRGFKSPPHDPTGSVR
jgi:SAM-dependent methyltransferase